MQLHVFHSEEFTVDRLIESGGKVASLALAMEREGWELVSFSVAPVAGSGVAYVFAIFRKPTDA